MLLGGKGANLAEMTKIGLPVPFGFTVTTEACNRYYEEGKTIGDDIVAAIFEKMEELEQCFRKEVRRRGKSSSGFCSFRGEDLDAGNDGHHFESGIK